MSYLKGIRTVIFPARDLEASIIAWTQVLGKAPAYQTPDFAASLDEENEIGLSRLPWVEHPLVFWKVEDIEEAHRVLVAAGAKAMGKLLMARWPNLAQPRSPMAIRRPASSMCLAAAWQS